ncbi:MAG: glycosyltransferase, partial [Pseudohongiellaceae bacterium]
QIDVLAPHAPGTLNHEVMEGITVYRYRYFFESLERLTYAGGILENLKKNPLNYCLVPFLLIAQAVALLRLIRKGNYRVMHAHWLIPQGFVCAIVCALPGKNIPALICTSHGGDLYALNNIFFTKIKRWIIARCRTFCVVSHAMKRKVTEMGIDPKHVEVMPMGVDLEQTFVPVPDIARQVNRLIYVGRLVEKKGVEVLLDAMQVLIPQFPDIELLIVGDGPLRGALEHKVRDAGMEDSVHFQGSVAHGQLPELYSSSSIAVVPSVIARSGDQEGLGLVIIEAMGCECAVVASDLEAIRDIITPETGVLVEPANPDGLTAAITGLLNDPERRNRLAVSGRVRARGLFDWGVSGEKYRRLLLAVDRSG